MLEKKIYISIKGVNNRENSVNGVEDSFAILESLREL